MPHDLRDQVVDFVRRWSDKTEIRAARLVSWAGLGRSKFFDWKSRYGKVNEHNGWIPRDHWLEDWEEKAIIDFHQKNPLEGYRRLTFMMLDADVVAVSPASVYRVLAGAGLLGVRNWIPSKKGTGFVQPLQPHEHWHIDVSYINICGTFYYLCSVLDGCSRLIVHWEIREQMKEADIETILQRAKEKHPQARTRIISDNGPQFIARDFKEFIRLSGGPMCGPARIIHKATASSNAGTRASNGKASVHAARSRWKTPARLQASTSNITTPGACTAPSVT